MWPIPLPTQLVSRVIIYAAFALFFFMVGMGVHKTFSDRKIARIERERAEERADAAAARAKQEQEFREKEARMLHDSNRREAEFTAALVQRDRIIRDSVVTGDGLRDALARTRADAEAAAAASPACRDVSQRTQTLALLLGERDRMAEESERVADDLRDELALCRGYVESVTKE